MTDAAPPGDASANEPTDSQLLERWQAGDKSAGSMLFERYYDAIERFFINKVSVGAGDLVQDTFRVFLEKCGELRDPSKLRSYLFSIAYRKLLEFIRSKQRHRGAIDFAQQSIQDLAPGPRSIITKQQEQRLLLAALRTIPANDQVILELYYWESLKVAEIAEVLGKPVPTTKGRLQRARARLENALRKLANSDDVLQSTISDLEKWARDWRQELGRDDS